MSRNRNRKGRGRAGGRAVLGLVWFGWVGGTHCFWIGVAGFFFFIGAVCAFALRFVGLGWVLRQ